MGLLMPDPEIAARQAEFSAAFKDAQRIAGGQCPIESGFFLNLADHECKHGRLPNDRSQLDDPCGCFSPKPGDPTATPATSTPDLMTTLKTAETKAKRIAKPKRKPKPKPDTLTLVISDLNREIERLTNARDELRKLAA